MNSAPTALAFRATIQLGGRAAAAIDIREDAEPRVFKMPPDLVTLRADAA